MSEVQVTNGTIKYGETRKIADCESKTGHVELSFNVAEGQDHNDAISHVTHLVHHHLAVILGHAPATPVAKPVAVKEVAPPKKAAAPKMPAPAPAVKSADPLDGEEMPPIPDSLKRTAEAPKAAAVDEENIDDLLGMEPAAPAKEITDKELMDAVQKVQSAVKNAVGIRKVLNGLGIKSPPGRFIDLPQDKRQQCIDELQLVKPLA